MSNSRIIPALLALLLLTGCSIKIHREYGHKHEEPLPPVVVYDDQDPTIRDIRAIKSLSFENHRHERLMRIAKRDHLSSDAQACLIQTAANSLSFENHRHTVFIALITNPAMNNAGRNAILGHLSSLKFENHRVDVLNKLDEVPIQYTPTPYEAPAPDDQLSPSANDR
ncbi:MAG: hypothetical protein KTR15_03620 [Phycisphaeraceae bacterium]|nr:hypothetical protein [Phycisphaeraceae bacterium]